ncbi:MAG TPA: hypothetical protein VM577_13720, partial [Anaerovoracaceae bacterium]|nr:hypothetical protein [Anaerovoracaceae bacterium]
KEEKQNMLDSGVIGKTSKKKNQWRIITSVAAVFAVGVLSFSLYHDVLGNLPDKLDGGEQSGIAQPDEIYNTKSADSADTNRTSDGSVIMKDQASALQPSAKTPDLTASNEAQNNHSNSLKKEVALNENPAANSADTQMPTYGLASGLEPNAGNGAGAVEDSTTEPEAAADAVGLDRDITKNKLSSTPEECSRSLTAPGVERNTAAVQYYNNLIEEKLEGFDYQILDSSYAQTGEWQFRIFIFRGKDGNTYNEEILILGKDGEIKVICSNEFMEL